MAEVVYNLTNDSKLDRMNQKRKSRIRDVCEMCKRTRWSMECNHVALDSGDRGDGRTMEFFGISQAFNNC